MLTHLPDPRGFMHMLTLMPSLVVRRVCVFVSSHLGFALCDRHDPRLDLVHRPGRAKPVVNLQMASLAPRQPRARTNSINRWYGRP